MVIVSSLIGYFMFQIEIANLEMDYANHESYTEAIGQFMS